MNRVKLLNISCIILVVLVILVVGNFYIEIFKSLNNKLSTDTVYDYQCDTLDDAVLASNRGSLDYCLDSISDYNSFFLSPLSVQGTLYNLATEETPSLFHAFGNGFLSWGRSSELFTEPSFMTLQAGSVSTSQELVGRLNSLSDNFIVGLSQEISFDENTSFSIFSYSAILKNGIHIKNTIHIHDILKYKITDTYKAVRVCCNDGTHAVYFIDGVVDDFTFDGFDMRELCVSVSPYIWQVTGSVDSLLSKFTDNEMDLRVIEQFGFDSSCYRVGKCRVQNNFSFDDDYFVILVNEESGLILGVGRR